MIFSSFQSHMQVHAKMTGTVEDVPLCRLPICIGFIHPFTSKSDSLRGNVDVPWVSRLRVLSSPAARSGGVAGWAHVHLIAPSWCIAVLKKKREDEESGCQLLDGRQRKEGGRVFAQSFTLLSPSSPLRSTAPSLLKGRSERGISA